MEPATRTPEGEPNRCPICGHALVIEPSRPPGDAPCPNCGCLLWFDHNSKEDDFPSPREWMIPVDIRHILQKPEITTDEFLSVIFQATRDVDKIIDLLAYAVSEKPGLIMIRQALRKLEFDKHPEPENIGRQTKLEIDSILTRIEEEKSRCNWSAVDRLAEEGFRLNPWRIQLHLALAESCRHRDLWYVEFFALDTASDIAPHNVEIKIAMAQLVKRARK
jgi:hypothetical protein